MSENTFYSRVVLKLSGESFSPPGERGISMNEVTQIAAQVQSARKTGCQMAMVIGGGNILRGSQFLEGNKGIHEATAHQMGMLATVINGLALQNALENLGCETRLMSSIPMDAICEPYIRRRAARHLERDRIVIIAAGTGRPYVTTDTAAALAALELDACVLLKATRVDGVYSEDPEKNPHATWIPHLSYNDVRERNLRVMDATAIAHCMEHEKPILVFNYLKSGNIERAVRGEKVGTLIDGQGPN